MRATGVANVLEFDREPIETDVLVVGGGIAGLMAAIRAAQEGVRVLVAEKANTNRSGSGATGNDHFCCYIPEIHGGDIAPILREYKNSLVGGYADDALATQFLERSFERVRDWDKWGIPMRPTGTWEFTGHAFPDRPRIWLKYAGENQKKVLTIQAKKKRVRIMNNLPVTDVITHGGQIAGAIGFSVRARNPVLQIIRAKSVVLATGSASRLYPSVSPGRLFNTAFCPSCTGAAQAAGYRAGAKLVNMEFPNCHAGPKYFARAGKATWIGLVADPYGKPVGPFLTKPSKELGDITADVWNTVFTDMFASGKGPAYMDCSATSPQDIEYMMWGMKHEGNTAMLAYMKDKAIDVRKHMVEFMRYEPHLIGRGIEIGLNGETSVSGLFAAGDPVGNFRADIAGAATYGWIAGAGAAERAKGRSEFEKMEDSPTARERAKICSRFMRDEAGPGWQEANMALQQIMIDYAGLARSETLLKAGLKYLGDLREEVLDTMIAANAHELMRCMEVLDLMECAEVIFFAALERKETRGLHKRLDFPFTNPLLQDRFITVEREPGEPRLRWRDRH